MLQADFRCKSELYQANSQAGWRKGPKRGATMTAEPPKQILKLCGQGIADSGNPAKIAPRAAPFYVDFARLRLRRASVRSRKALSLMNPAASRWS